MPLDGEVRAGAESQTEAGRGTNEADVSTLTAGSEAASAYPPDNTMLEGSMSTVDESSLQNIARERYAVEHEDGALRDGGEAHSPGSSRRNQSSGASDVAGGGIGGDESMAHVPSRGLFSDDSAAHEHAEYARLRGSQDASAPPNHDEGTLKGGWGYAGSKHLTKAEMANIVAVSRMKWGSDPQMFTCPYCQNEDYSANHMEHTPFVWTGVALVCMLGCWFGCCLAPLCTDSIKNVRHQCSKCHRVVGYRRACGTCRVGTHKTCCCGRDEFVEYIQELDARSSQLQSGAAGPGLPPSVMEDSSQKFYTF